MYNSIAIMIMVLLAYSIVEFIFRDRLNLWCRTGLLMLILVVELFWKSVTLYQYTLIPIAGFSYLAISFLQSRAKAEVNGHEFRDLVFTYLTHIIAFCAIYVPLNVNWYPVSTVKMNYSHLYITRWEILLLILIVNIWLAPRLIRAILNDLTFRACASKDGEIEPSRITDHGAIHSGTLIGILERLLIIATVLLSTGNAINISMIGFILGTKSLARFKKFDNQEFVEYFIIGTMASVLFALVTVWPLQIMFF